MDQVLCSGCATAMPTGIGLPRGRSAGAKRWCSKRCFQWAQAHPDDFFRIFRWCKFCGLEIDDLPTNAKYCSSGCWRRAQQPERPVSCAICFADLPVGRLRSIYCSPRCGSIAAGRQRAESLPVALCALPECGQAFYPFMTKQRCCSEKHGKLLYNRESRADGRQKSSVWNDKRRDNYHRRRALKKAASTGKPVLFAEIAERDGWRCCICKKAVNPKLKWPHSKSPSLDHLVPLSKGGAHDPSNVALAHLGCNSAKNNRGGGEQLLLVG